MLILTRKRGTSIRIGEDIVITVIHSGRTTVKLGIDAPASVKVTRGELTAWPNHSDCASVPEEALLLQH
jgi:carbon storage regulator